MRKSIPKYLTLIVILFITNSCSKDENGLEHRNIIGNYILISAYKSGLYTDSQGSYGFSEDIISECGSYNKINFKSNGTLELREFSGNNCETQVIKNGSWQINSTFDGRFIGELNFNGSTLVQDLFEISHNGDNATEISIEYWEENPPANISSLRFYYKYRREN
jgi:hypothetical protein